MAKPGYWVVRANGSIASFYAAPLGDLSKVKLHRPIVAATPTPDGRGYWLVASDGGVFAFGDARYMGSPANSKLTEPIVGVAATPDGAGYWLVSADGGIFSYGDAGFYGSMGDKRLNKPIVSMAATPDGKGYWLVASDGGIFAFGDAGFFGSTGSIRLNKPIVSMAPTSDGKGYWLVASDGGIFNYGDARFYGSTGSRRLGAPIVSMARTPDGAGYWLAQQNGRVWSFGDAPNLGSQTAPASVPGVVAMAVTTDWVPTVTTTTVPVTTTTVPRTTTTVARTTTTVARTTTTVPRTTTSRPTTTRPTTTRPTTTTTVPRTTTSVPATTTTTTPPSGSYPYPGGGLGYDVSWPQCSPIGSSKAMALPKDRTFAVVGVNNGTIGGYNPCFLAEVAWAGPNPSVYIILEPASPKGGPMEMTGPKASCAKTSNLCQGYDWGYNYAEDDLGHVKADGVSPRMWWLDIETAENWPTAKTLQPINASIIQGALDAIKTAGHKVGIYSTWYQWGEITGSYVPTAQPALWVPGAGNVYGGGNSALSFCTRALSAGDPKNIYSTAIGFADGLPWLVQYGYGVGPPAVVDPDYACGAP